MSFTSTKTRATTRDILMVWGLLMALTLALALAADVAHASRLGPLMIGVVAAAAAVKAHLVLRTYLGLGAAPGALSGFTTAAVAALLTVAASFLFFATPQ
jgi:hypothetical protein